MLAPIVLFIYNRPEHTLQTLDALSKNTLAKASDLIIFCDGSKENATQEQIEKINQAREIAKSKQWCKTVEIRESEKNKGLATSIIEGVTETVNKYGKIIVLEDDIVTGKYFLEYMNTALDKYKDDKKVFHIDAFRYPIKDATSNSSFFYPIMACWGWGTWVDRWQYYKKDAAYYKSVFTKKMIYKFNMDGADKDKWSQIERNLSGKINTWAIFWGASIFINNGLCLSPSISLVKNIGLDGSGEHCTDNKDLQINNFENTKILSFPTEVKIDKKEYGRNKNFARHMHLHRMTLVSVFGMLLPETIKKPLRKILNIEL